MREMRRRKQELTIQEAQAILRAGDHGVLALHGDDGYPYAVPLNYVYVEDGLDGDAEQGAIYFHCAREGHKVDAVRHNPQASFCVVGAHEVVPDTYSTDYQSVIAFGRLHILDEGSARKALFALGERYNPGAPEATAHEVAKDGPRCLVLELEIDHLTAKQSLSLARRASDS